MVSHCGTGLLVKCIASHAFPIQQCKYHALQCMCTRNSNNQNSSEKPFLKVSGRRCSSSLLTRASLTSVTGAVGDRLNPACCTCQASWGPGPGWPRFLALNFPVLTETSCGGRVVYPRQLPSPGSPTSPTLELGGLPASSLTSHLPSPCNSLR